MYETININTLRNSCTNISWEYWGKRKGSYWVDRKTSHKMERMQLKEEDREIVKDALFELGEGTHDLSKCSVYKSERVEDEFILFLNIIYSTSNNGLRGVIETDMRVDYLSS